jgi:hypothetical protein
VILVLERGMGNTADRHHYYGTRSKFIFSASSLQGDSRKRLTRLDKDGG